MRYLLSRCAILLESNFDSKTVPNNNELFISNFKKLTKLYCHKQGESNLQLKSFNSHQWNHFWWIESDLIGIRLYLCYYIFPFLVFDITMGVRSEFKISRT